MENFKTVHNVETNKIEQVPLTADEVAQLAKDVKETEANQKAVAEAKASKEALLQKLGITADEAKLLLS